MARSRPVEHLLLLARRVRGGARSLRALLALVVGLRRQGVRELWIGDSHAVCLNMPLHVSPWSRGAEGQVVLHLGGRLMHSTAARGLPPQVHRVARLVRRLTSARTTVVPFLCAGEIDVRCHLVPRLAEPGGNLDFVGGYVRRAAELAEEMGAPCAVVVVPTPQSDDVPEVAKYPIRGTIAERVAVAERVRVRLIDEAARWQGPPAVLVLDANDLLADATGAMRADLTDDGVHTNDAGIALVRSRVRELELGQR